MSKPPKSVVETVQKEFPEFAAEVESLQTEDLNARIARLAKDNQEVQDAKEADEGLEIAKAVTAERSAPYREAKRAISLKVRYIINLLKDRGNPVL